MMDLLKKRRKGNVISLLSPLLFRFHSFFPFESQQHSLSISFTCFPSSSLLLLLPWYRSDKNESAFSSLPYYLLSDMNHVFLCLSRRTWGQDGKERQKEDKRTDRVKGSFFYLTADDMQDKYSKNQVTSCTLTLTSWPDITSISDGRYFLILLLIYLIWPSTPLLHESSA